MLIHIPFYILIFLYGIVIGSFLNVCIFRLPQSESVIRTPSHCMSCGAKLKWYHLIPLFSYLALKGRCHECQHKISIQYPIIEFVNGVLYCLIFGINGWNITSILYCLLTSALIVLSLIDLQTFQIPFAINVFIFSLGLINLILDFENWRKYILGSLVVSCFLYFVFIVSKGQAIGGGDIKLMVASGLLLGWERIILAFFLGCILGSIIHLIRMKVNNANHVLALGPYLSAGVFISALWGKEIILWYINIYL